MEFISGLQWGTGLSLGFCVGLVAWVLLREGLNRLLGITCLLDEHREFNRATLEALLSRNRLAVEGSVFLERIAVAIEMFEDDDDGDSWKLPVDNQG